MSAPTCTGPDCARPVPDAYLCTGCTRTLERILAELPATLTDLQTTITRQARTTRGAGGKPTKASDPPLPFDVHASDLAHRVRIGLSTWIRHLCETRGVPVPRFPATAAMWRNTPRGPEAVPAEPIGAMAVWLVAHIESIRQDEAAGELLTNLKAIQSELRAAVDNREYRYAGTCRAVLRPLVVSIDLADVRGDVSGDVPMLITRAVTGDSAPCGADLRLRVGATTIVCRDCGTEYDATEQAAWIDKESAEALAPAAVIAHALAEAGFKVKPVTIRKWADRTREWMAKAARRKDGDPPLRYEEHPIQQVACSLATRQPEYRVGDVYRRVKADPTRHPDRQEIGA